MQNDVPRVPQEYIDYYGSTEQGAYFYKLWMEVLHSYAPPRPVEKISSGGDHFDKKSYAGASQAGDEVSSTSGVIRTENEVVPE